MEFVKTQIEEWLNKAGLELKPSKTRIRHTSEGFNFLGFNARQYKVGKYRASKISNGSGNTLGFATLIKPTKEAIKIHMDELGKIIDASHNASQAVLITRLNSLISGWSNYYSTQVSKESFAKCDDLLHKKLLAWAKRKCTHSNAQETIDNYWRILGDRNWAFATKDGEIRLAEHAKTPIVRHTKVKERCSPFDGNEVYWGKRFSKFSQLSTRVKLLLKTQVGCCSFCGQSFKDGETLEVDHITPITLGGKDQYNNLQLLHRHCHDTKTANDGSIISYEAPITNGSHSRGAVCDESHMHGSEREGGL